MIARVGLESWEEGVGSYFVLCCGWMGGWEDGGMYALSIFVSGDVEG